MNNFFKWNIDNLWYQESNKEHELSKDIRNIMNNRKINVAYNLDIPSYALEHVLPLSHVLVGPFIYISDNPQMMKNRTYMIENLKIPENMFIEIVNMDIIKEFLDLSYNNLLICYNTGGTIPKKWLHLYDNLIMLEPSVIEAVIYNSNDKINPYNPPQIFPSMVFSKFNSNVAPYQTFNDIGIQINPAKPIVIYVGSFFETDNINNKDDDQMMLVMNYYREIINQLRSCMNDFNVIIAPNLHTYDSIVKDLLIDIPHINPKKYPYLRKLIELADVIIGTYSIYDNNVLASATVINKKIIYIPYIDKLSKLKLKNLPINNQEYLLNHRNSHIITPVYYNNKNKNKGKNIQWIFNNEVSKWDRIIKMVINNRNPEIEYGNQIYSKYWFGYLDGYEEYRVTMIILSEILKINIDHLISKYLSFNTYTQSDLKNELDSYIKAHSTEYMRSHEWNLDRENIYSKCMEYVLSTRKYNTETIHELVKYAKKKNNFIGTEVSSYLHLSCELRSIDKYSISTNDIIQKYLSKHNVYISVTTSPLRIKYLLWVLFTLNLENVKNIYINLPKTMRGMAYKYIPKYITDFPKVYINHFDKDYGPASKLLPTCEAVSDPNALIITIDDDTLYPYDLVNTFIKEIIENENCVCGTSARNVFKWDIDSTKWLDTNNMELPYHNVIEGCGSIIYKKKYINVERMKKLISTGIECQISDDIVISWHLAEQQINRKKIATSIKYKQLDYGHNADALHKGAGLGKSLDKTHNAKYSVAVEKLWNAYEKKPNITHSVIEQLLNQYHIEYWQIPNSHNIYMTYFEWYVFSDKLEKHLNKSYFFKFDKPSGIVTVSINHADGSVDGIIKIKLFISINTNDLNKDCEIYIGEFINNSQLPSYNQVTSFKPNTVLLCHPGTQAIYEYDCIYPIISQTKYPHNVNKYLSSYYKLNSKYIESINDIYHSNINKSIMDIKSRGNINNNYNNNNYNNNNNNNYNKEKDSSKKNKKSKKNKPKKEKSKNSKKPIVKSIYHTDKFKHSSISRQYNNYIYI